MKIKRSQLNEMIKTIIFESDEPYDAFDQLVSTPIPRREYRWSASGNPRYDLDELDGALTCVSDEQLLPDDPDFITAPQAIEFLTEMGMPSSISLELYRYFDDEDQWVNHGGPPGYDEDHGLGEEADDIDEYTKYAHFIVAAEDGEWKILSVDISVED